MIPPPARSHNHDTAEVAGVSVSVGGQWYTAEKGSSQGAAHKRLPTQRDLQFEGESRVIELAEQFVPLKIDCDEDGAVAKRFKVRSYPTIIFADAKGRRVEKLKGYRPAKRFAKNMEDVLKIHGELGTLQAKFDGEPPDLEAGSKLAKVYANRGDASLAKKTIRKIEQADPEDTTGRLTEAYLALGEYYLDEEEKHKMAIRWYTKVVDQGLQSEAVAEARYRIAVAYFDSRTKHSTKSSKFGAKLRSARQAIDALLSMDGLAEELRLQATDLAESISKDLALHEKLSKD